MPYPCSGWDAPGEENEDAPATKRQAKARRAVEATPVPAGVAALLRSLSLELYGPEMCDKLGLSSADDLHHVTSAMLREFLPAMKPVECTKLLAAVRSSRASSVSSASETEAAGACDIMLSYRVSETGDGAGGDKSVFQLQAALQRLGFSVFVGETSIQGGDTWPITIQEGVRHCKAFVALCSPTYGDRALSPWTLDELTMAKNNRKPLIPVWHSGAFPPPSVEIMLGALNRIPSGNLVDGYAAAGISHDCVAKQVAAALRRIGVVPSLAKVAG